MQSSKSHHAAAARLYWQGLSVLHAALALPLLLAGQATAAAVAAAGCAACAAIACRFHQPGRAAIMAGKIPARAARRSIHPGQAARAAMARRFHQAARPGNVKTSSRRALIGD